MPYQKRSDRRGGENFAAGAVSEGTVAGRNAFRELLASGRSIDKVFVQRGERSGSITLLIAQALERKIPVIEADKRKLVPFRRRKPSGRRCAGRRRKNIVRWTIFFLSQPAAGSRHLL